jgi:hypothetical protein
MKRLIAGAAVAAGFVVALLATCEGPVEYPPKSADVAGPGAADVPGTSTAPPRRTRAARGESTPDQADAEDGEETPTEPIGAADFVVVPVEVVDAETGRPVAGATVIGASLDGVVTVTDPDGHAVLRLAPAATVEIRTRSAGHVASTDFVRTAPIGASQPSLRIELASAGSLHGVVRDPDGMPVGGAIVYVQRDDVGDVLQGGLSGADGTYVVEGLAFAVSHTAKSDGGTSGQSTIYASSPSAPLVPTRERPIVVADLRLRRYGTLEITVLDGDDPIDDGLRVGLRLSFEDEEGGRQSRSGGRDASLHAMPGRGTLTVSLDDRAPATETVDVPEGGTVKKTIHLTRGETIAGIVVDDAGAPVEDAWVRDGAATNDPREHRSNTRTRADGTFELTLLTAGEHELSVSSPFEYEDVVGLGISAPSENARIVVQRRGVLSLRAVFDDDAKPAAGARIAFHGMLNGTPWHADRTLPRDGRFEIAWPAGVGGDVGIAVDGFVPVTRSVTVPALATVDLGEIRMRPACALSGVLRGDDGAPRSGATLVARGPMGDQEGKTDAGGRFSFRGLSSGTLRIDLAKPPHTSFRVDVPSTKDVVLVVPRSGLLQVFASSGSGQRLAARRVEVRDADGVTVDEGPTDANGSWTSDLAPGRYSVDIDNGPHGKAEVRADDVTVLRLR